MIDHIKTEFGKVEYSEQHELLTITEKVLGRLCIMYGIPEITMIHAFLSQLPCINQTKQALDIVDNMCAESLDPETHDNWEDVKATLLKNRKSLTP